MPPPSSPNMKDANTPRQPALFVSHGSPMFALEHGSTAPALRAWAAALPHKPRGIVIMSPHWMAPGVQVMTSATPQTWHDFGGFDPALYQLQYPAAGDPVLAQQVITLLQTAGITAQGDTQRPFDHGAWVPLMHLFPAADIPVVQVALPADYTPTSVMAIGAALASLREQGVLLIGSGSMTHNLREFMQGRPALADAPAPYASEFARWIENAVVHNDKPAMLAYSQHAPHATRAHPTDEHFATLYFALGAAGWGSAPAPDVHYISREVMYKYLAMDALALA
jgi:4,5-DOPA dioxygenase extradiol